MNKKHKKSFSTHTKNDIFQKISENNKNICSALFRAKFEKFNTTISSTNLHEFQEKTHFLPSKLIMNNSQNTSFCNKKYCTCCKSTSFHHKIPLNPLNPSFSNKNELSDLQNPINLVNIYSNRRNEKITKNLKLIENKEKSLISTQDFFKEYFPLTNRKSFEKKLIETTILTKKPIKNEIKLEDNSIKLPDFWHNNTGNRKEMKGIIQWFEYTESEIEKQYNNKENSERFNKLFELYNLCLNEIISIIWVEFQERGNFLYEIWKKFNGILASQKLFIENNIEEIDKKSSEKTTNYLKNYNFILEKKDLKINELNSKIEILEKKNYEILENSKKEQEILIDLKKTNQKLNFYLKKLHNSYSVQKKNYDELLKKYEIKAEFLKLKENDKIPSLEKMISLKTEKKLLEKKTPSLEKIIIPNKIEKNLLEKPQILIQPSFNSLISENSMLSMVELDQIDSSNNKIEVKELNNLVIMVNPDKFQIACQENYSQTDRDLLKDYIINEEIQTPTYLIDKKYDNIFVKNTKINEFLQEYLQKKEVENMCNEYNISDLHNTDNVIKNIEEMIDESKDSMKIVHDFNSFLDSFMVESENFIENTIVSENLKQKAIPIIANLINTPVLKTKTLHKIREFLLKIIQFYLKESSKNQIFGEEIRYLNKIINDLKLENESLKKNMELYSSLVKDNSHILDSNILNFQNDEISDEELEDSESLLESDSKYLSKKKRNFNYFRQSLPEEERKKIINPGLSLINQLKAKNINNFNNPLSIKTVYKIIYQIYQDRMILQKENPKIKEMDFPSFVYNYFIKLYGFRKMAQQKFLLFVLTIRKYNIHFRINLFNRFLGLSDLYSIDLLNQYINALENLYSSYQNSENESKFMVSAVKTWEFTRFSLENKFENCQNELFILKKEIDNLKEDDPKKSVKFGILDFDLFITKYLNSYKNLKNKAKNYLHSVFAAADLNSDGFCDIVEFCLIFKNIENELFLNKGKEYPEKMFEEFANAVCHDRKSLNFNQFCSICEEKLIFDEEKIQKFIGKNNEDEFYKELINDWEKRKTILKEKNKGLDLGIEMIEKKIEKINKNNETYEKLAVILLYKILENE